jgi:rod shape determining protein RodA
LKASRSPLDLFTWVALATLAAVVGLSLLTMRNADFYSGESYYPAMVLRYLGAGACFAIAAIMPLRLWYRLAYPLYTAGVGLVVLTAFIGEERNHSRRWLDIGLTDIQPSELVKLGVVLLLAAMVHRSKEPKPGEPSTAEAPTQLKHLALPLLLALVPAGFVLFQPDLGTAIVIGILAVTVVLYEGIPRWAVAGLVAVLLIGGPIAWQTGLIRGYQMERVHQWMDPDWGKLDVEAAALRDQPSQPEVAEWAIGSGQFWGQGSRGGGRMRLKHLPEMHTDMIVAAYAEEQGFLGCVALLLLLWLLTVWCLRAADVAKERFCALLAAGVAAMIGWQVFINVGMASGLLPVVGLPLPFMSYGGSSIVTLMTSLGLVLNVTLHRGRL